MSDEALREMRIILRENDVPFFDDDEEIKLYYAKNNRNFNRTLYELCNVKAMNTSLVMSGLTTPETHNYFLNLANMYRPVNSGIMGE